MMEDDTADPPSPPAISSDDMDMESACLSDEIDSPSSDIISSSSSSSSGSAAPRVDVQTQCEDGEELDDSRMLDMGVRPKLSQTASVPSNPPLAGNEKQHDLSLNQHQQGCHKDVENVNSLLFDSQAMEC